MTGDIRPAIAIMMAVLSLLSACSAPDDAAGGRDAKPRRISVRIYYSDSTTPNVLISVPLRTVTAALRVASIAGALGAHIEIGEDDDRTVRLDAVEFDAVRKALQTTESGPVLQVEEGGERVEIWVE